MNCGATLKPLRVADDGYPLKNSDPMRMIVTPNRLPLPGTDDVDPPALPFTAAERHLVQRLRTPDAVQRWLNALPYNTENERDTMRSFRGVVRTGTAHCLEAAISAAVILEQHGYPPIVLGF